MLKWPSYSSYNIPSSLSIFKQLTEIAYSMNSIGKADMNACLYLASKYLNQLDSYSGCGYSGRDHTHIMGVTPVVYKSHPLQPHPLLLVGYKIG